jgi:drug/metabolite transporter (DMT)-like permease
MTASLLLFAGGTSTGIMLCLAGLALVRAWRGQRSTVVAGADARLTPTPAGAPWMRRVLARSALVLAVLLAYGLCATAALAQPTLTHVDPLIFAALETGLLFPLGVILLAWTWRSSTGASVRQGLVGGLPLGLGIICVALSLHTLGIIPAALLSALDGLMASLISWLVLRQSLSVLTGLAAGCASLGAALLWWMAPAHWQSELIALACGLLFPLYAFHVERHGYQLRAFREHLLPFFGGLLCALALSTLALALCFGRWTSLQNLTTTDLGVVLSCGLATVLLPQVVLTLLLRKLSAVTLAFCAVLEPLCSIGCAWLWGTLALPLVGWCGVALILLSLLVQAGASRLDTPKPLAIAGTVQDERCSSPEGALAERMMVSEQEEH